jgi:hypothetical protein
VGRHFFFFVRIFLFENSLIVSWGHNFIHFAVEDTEVLKGSVRVH